MINPANLAIQTGMNTQQQPRQVPQQKIQQLQAISTTQKKLSKDQVKQIITNAPQGSDPKDIINRLVSKGYELEGLNEKTNILEKAGQQIENLGSGIAQSVTSRGNLGKKAGIAVGQKLREAEVATEKAGIAVGQKARELFGKERLTPEQLQKIGAGRATGKLTPEQLQKLEKGKTAQTLQGITDWQTPEQKESVAGQIGYMAGGLAQGAAMGAPITQLAGKGLALIPGATKAAAQFPRAATLLGGAAKGLEGQAQYTLTAEGRLPTKQEAIFGSTVGAGLSYLPQGAKDIKGLVKGAKQKAASGKEFVTRTLPVSRIEKDLGLTPTTRETVERTGITPGQYILEKNLGGAPREQQVNELAKIADESYNNLTSQLKPITKTYTSPDAQKMLETMVDEMNSSKILAREYPEYISKLQELQQQGIYTPSELLAIRRDFDRIVGNQIFNQKGRVSGAEDKAIAGRRRKLADLLENVGQENGLDIKAINNDIRNSTAIRDGLLKRLSQENKNNTFGLQDIGIGAILSAGDPVAATAIVIGKKALEKAVPGMSQKLYNINKSKYVPRNLNRNVPISTRDTTAGFSITPSNTPSMTTAGVTPTLQQKTPVIPQKTTKVPRVGEGKLGKETLEQDISSIKTKADYPERKNRQREYSRDSDSPVKFTSGTRPTYKRHVDGYIGNHHEWVRNTGAGFYDIFGGFSNVPKVKLDLGAERSYYDSINNLLVTKKHSGTEFNFAVQDYLEKKTGISFDDYSKLPSAKPVIPTTKEEVFINQLKTAQKYSDQAKDTDYNLGTIKRNIRSIESSNRMGRRAEEELSKWRKRLDKVESAYKTKQNQFENAVVNAKKLGVKTVMSLDEKGIPVVYFETPKGQVSFHAPNYGYSDFNTYDSVSELVEYLPAKVKDSVELVDNYKRSGLTNSKEIIDKLTSADFNKTYLPLKKK